MPFTEHRWRWFFLTLIASHATLMLACGGETADQDPLLDDAPIQTGASTDAGTPVVTDQGMSRPDDSVSIEDATPEYCGSCHSTHLEQWRSSMHAYATRDPIFLALNRKGIEETKGKLDQFCVQCHAPNASQRKLLPVVEVNGRFEMPIDMTNPLISNGVQCISCHNIESVEATQNAKVKFSTTTHFGPTGSQAAQDAHPIKSSKLFSDPAQKNIMCGSCHDFVNPNGVRLDSTFSSWYANGYNTPRNPETHRTCQDCHMPAYQGSVADGSPTTTVHSHYFGYAYQALLRISGTRNGTFS